MIFRRLTLAAILIVACLTSAARAGGGPENVLLVVNQNSEASKTIANYYIQLRDIPPGNVVYLDWQGGSGVTKGKPFREKILRPVLAAIQERRLAMQIDYIVYSADFPWRIDFRGDLAKLGENTSAKFKKQFNQLASLNGATYLWGYVLQKNPAMVMPEVNWYVPEAAVANHSVCKDCAGVVTRGFRARYGLEKGGKRSADPKVGQRYFLSTLLGVTVERGNSVKEVVTYLRRAAAIDAKQPEGTFYFMKRNNDPRSKARHECFAGIVASLKAKGGVALIVQGSAPKGALDVVGLTAGAPEIPIDGQGIRIMPGAIVDNFTSYGGDFSNSYQTKLSEFLRAGAAGASGTVAEPYAIQAKFPLPSIHLHYRRGCSLAEAFYQSVSCPYQLLIVGDPLCQPWARPPTVALKGLEPNATVEGIVELKTKVTPQLGTKAGKCDLFVDGRLVVARFPHMLPIPLNTAGLSPGHHEIRVVCSTDDPLEFQGRVVVPFQVADRESAGEVIIRVIPDNAIPSNQFLGNTTPLASTLRLNLSGPESAACMELLQGHRVVGRVEGSTGEVEIEVASLGRGPVALWARAISEAEEGRAEKELGRSAPTWLQVE